MTVHRIGMAPRRLSEDEKQELVVRYRKGEATAALAETFGCSPNTVSRTVKSLLSEDEYTTLKLRRQKGGQAQLAVDPSLLAAEPECAAASEEPASDARDPELISEEDAHASEEESSGTLALDDADDFADDSEEDPEDEEVVSLETGAFQEVVPLMDVGDLTDRREIQAQPLSSGLLPATVYMLVDKVVELDPKPLRDFPDLGPLDDTELERSGLCLFSSPRTAKRQCGRSQRVIKVPDTGLLERTAPFILAQGISRVVLDSTLYALPGS